MQRGQIGNLFLIVGIGAALVMGKMLLQRGFETGYMTKALEVERRCVEVAPPASSREGNICDYIRGPKEYRWE